MSHRLAVFALPCVLFIPVLVLGQEEKKISSQEVLVTANRVEQERSLVASSVSVIDAAEIESRGQAEVADLLRGEEGVDVVRSGPHGGNASVFLRGANPEHTLVIVDGVEVNNPVNPTRSYNFANLDLTNVERVEILRGPQSVIYGSDALGGVIIITTKKGQGAPKLEFSSEGGSYSTFNQQAALSGSDRGAGYSLAYRREDSAGISAARASHGNSEKDGYRKNSFSGRVSFDPDQTIGADFIGRFLGSSSDLDNAGGIAGDDPNRLFKDREGFVRAQVRTTLLDGNLRQTAGVSYNDQRYEDDNDPDIDHALDYLRSHYDGDALKFDVLNQIALSEGLDLILGAETERERASSAYFSDGEFGPFESNFDQRSVRTNGYFSQLQLEWGDSFASNFGLRVDDHEKFGSEVTWRVAPVLKLCAGKTRLFSTVGTAFKAPSLYQLYSEYGREDLGAERSLGIDAGIEQRIFSDHASISATWFRNNFDDLISFDPATFIFENISKAKSYGAEFGFNFQPLEELQLGSALTLMRTEDETTGLALLRRPKTKLSLRARYQVNQRLQLGADLVFTGSRIDNDFNSFPAERRALASYTLLNASAQYALTQDLNLFVRLENLLDSEYEEVLGYGTLGSAAYAGIKLTL